MSAWPVKKMEAEDYYQLYCTHSSASQGSAEGVRLLGLACENLMLAFRARGWDTCPLEGLDSRRVRKLLALPGDASVVMVIAAGKRAPQGVYGPRLRFDRALFIKEV